MEVLPDGRFVFLRERTLRIYDPEDDSTIEKELSNYYWQNRGLVVLNNNNDVSFVYFINFNICSIGSWKISSNKLV